ASRRHCRMGRGRTRGETAATVRFQRRCGVRGSRRGPIIQGRPRPSYPTESLNSRSLMGNRRSGIMSRVFMRRLAVFNRSHVAVAMMSWATALLISGPARAAEGPAAKISVAFVDVGRVMAEAKPVSALDEEFKGTLSGQQKQLDQLYAGRLLD